MIFPVCRSFQIQTGGGLLFGHIIGYYGKSTIKWNYFGQSFNMAKSEAFRTYCSSDRPPL